jgi:hypothetical protein
MRLGFPFGSSQVLSLFVLILPVLLFSGCRRDSNETPVVPPATHPLSREYIGYGVVNVSFTHLLSEPGSNGTSGGYLRRGTVVRVIERRLAPAGEISGAWVLAERNYETPGASSRGWLEESSVDIYDNEAKALTASKGMNL